MGITWDNPPSTAVPEMTEEYRRRLHGRLVYLARAYAPQVETWMKENAVWVDRTAVARQSLWAEVFEFTDLVVLAFGHGVDYGTFLELSNQGRFSIIFPALDYFGPKIWADAKRLLD